MIKIPMTVDVPLSLFYYVDDNQTTFRVHAKNPAEWANTFKSWEENGKDKDKAKEVMSLAFISVTQGKDKQFLDTVTGVDKFIADIEKCNEEGAGDALVSSLITNHYIWYFNRLAEKVEDIKKK